MVFQISRNEFQDVFARSAIVDQVDICNANNRPINKFNDHSISNADLKQHYEILLINWINTCKKQQKQQEEVVYNFDKNLFKDSIILLTDGFETEGDGTFTKFSKILTDFVRQVLKVDFFSEKINNETVLSFNEYMTTDFNGIYIENDFLSQIKTEKQNENNLPINLVSILNLLKFITDIKEEYIQFYKSILLHYNAFLIDELMISPTQHQDMEVLFLEVDNFINSLFLNMLLGTYRMKRLFILHIEALLFYYFKIDRKVDESKQNSKTAAPDDEKTSLIEILNFLNNIGMKNLLKSILMTIYKFHCRKFLIENFNADVKNSNSNSVLLWLINRNYDSFQILYQLFDQKQAANINEANKNEKEIITAFFLHQLNEQLLNLNVLNLFQIIKNFGSSEFSNVSILQIQDKFSTKRKDTIIQQRKILINSFISNLKLELLNPGVETLRILKYYILMIKSFNLLEPNGVLLDIASRPIRKYLKDRNDTINHIVVGLLSDEKEKSENNLNLTQYLVDDDKEFHDDNNGKRLMIFDDHNYSLNWTPAPIDALPDFQQQEKLNHQEKIKPINIIECLTTLFDSKKVFINEFLNKFSRKLISSRNDDKEIILLIFKVQILKKLFIKNNINDLNNLDIMINDILESKKYNAYNKNKALSTEFFKNTVVSYLFWPKDLINVNECNNRDIGFQLPQYFQKQYDFFAKNYQIRNPGRVIEPIYDLGQVEVELDLKDRKKTFTVTPDLASIIYLFNSDDDDKESKSTILRLNYIAEKLQFNNLDKLKSKIQYWINNRILKEVSVDTYQVSEVEGNELNSVTGNSNFEHEEHNGNSNNGNNELNDKMEKYLPFIIAMLTNLGAMDLSKMKNLLSFTIPQELNFNCNDSELQDYLNYLVEEEKLEFIGGKSYKLKK